MGAGILGCAHQRLGRAHGCEQVPGAAAQAGGHLLAGAVFDQAAGQLGFHPLGLRRAGQQQRAFHLYQVGGHVDELAGRIHPVPLYTADDRGVLVNQLHDVDVVQVHFIFAHQIQQQIQRAFEIFQFEGQCLHAATPSTFVPGPRYQINLVAASSQPITALPAMESGVSKMPNSASSKTAIIMYRSYCTALK